VDLSNFRQFSLKCPSNAVQCTLSKTNLTRSDAIPELEYVLKIFIENKVAESYVRPIKLSIEALKAIQSSEKSRLVLNWIRENSWLSILVLSLLSLLLLWLILLLLHPLLLLRVNDVFAPYLDFALPDRLGGLKIPLRYVLLVGFFHYHRRVLDAWVTQNLDTAKENFKKKTTVKDREIYVSMPVFHDGETIANLTPDHLRPTFNNKRECLLIHGEGGAGKTSLACQIAQWGMSKDKTEYLCAKYVMLPVLIEEDLDICTPSGKNPFIEAIRGELGALVNAESPVHENLLLQLLKRRRILVIVDHLSEMNEATRKAVRPHAPDFQVNALIVTSRIEENLGGVPKTALQPLRIEGDYISDFMGAYLRQRSKRALFKDPEYFRACERLSLMVGDRKITVLLAKLYAEQMISAKEGETENGLPENIPDLMLNYLNEVNRGISEKRIDDRKVHLVAKIIAWECLRKTFRPTPAKRDEVLTALKGQGDVEMLLEYFENRLRLIQTVGAGRDQIRFNLDPLAEYLASLYLLDLSSRN
jgi:hypothetical protein